MKRPVHDDGRVHGAIVGCPRADGRWLLIRRAATLAAAPLKICFPGGAVEVGEHHEVAAAREFREELGVHVRLEQLVWHHVFDDRPLTLWGYLGYLESDELSPDPQEVAETLWLTADEVTAHADVLPRTDAFIAALMEAIRKQPTR